MEFYKLEIIGIFEIQNFWNFLNSKLLEFSKFDIIGIFLIGSYWNFPDWKINWFLNFQFVKLSKFQKLTNFNYSSIRYSTPLVILSICRWKIYSSFIFYCSNSRKFSRSTFKHLFFIIHKLIAHFNNFSNCKILIFQMVKLIILKISKL